AGGPTTVALAQAGSGVGGFPFLAGGYKSVEALATEVAVLRASGGDFGFNLFVPSREMGDAEAFSIYSAKLQSEVLPYG
ncbi:nitronate monooxygenase, partial [Xylella fastidiosa subsp. multiplex]|nr:nitronate monooxygenase [Xylella fastidiosa subsp. multiplex]